MIIQRISDMVGQPAPKFKCSKCQDAYAEMIWLGLALEISTGQKQRWAEGNLYFCKGCAVDVCLGLLRDVAELEQGRGNNDPMWAWEKLSPFFRR